MVAVSTMTPEAAPGVVSAATVVPADTLVEGRFSRADLVFTGVDHSDRSYEVRVFLNNRGATAETPRTAENGYAGRYVVFGHGGCFGGSGHCDVPTEPRGPYDLRPQHPLTPQTKIVTVTDALNRVLDADPKGLESITLVPVSKDPLRKDRGPSESVLRFADMDLRTYL